jgi:hypothetical protein
MGANISVPAIAPAQQTDFRQKINQYEALKPQIRTRQLNQVRYANADLGNLQTMMEGSFFFCFSLTL